IERLSREKEYFKKFKNIWEWVYLEDEKKVDEELKYLEYIKNAIIREYWKEDIFISSSALDDIIFFCIQNCAKNEIVAEIRSLVDQYGLTNNSVVIFPLTNFGFKFGGLGKFFRTQAISY